MNTTFPFLRRGRGFTLVEVCVAMGIFSFALMALIGMLPFTQSQMEEGGARAQWDRFQAQLKSKVNGGGYATAMAALDNGKALYFYRYRSNGTARADGSMTPDVQGGVLVSEAAARWEDDPLLGDDLKAIYGALFRVKLERFPTGSIAGGAVTASTSASATPAWAVAEQIPFKSSTSGKQIARKAVFLQP